jgi:hypothetical protein
MKNLLFAAFIGLISLQAKLQAQVCTPAQNITQVGFHPDTIPYGEENVPYTATIHVKTPKDTVVVFGGFPVRADIDSVKVTGVLGMPAGFTFRCDNSRCVYVHDSIGCGTFSGTPTQGGIYPLQILVTTFARVGFPVTQRDTIRRFVLRVEPVPATGIARSSQPRLQVFPNPASGQVQIFIPQTLAATDIRIWNAAGKCVWQQKAMAGANTIKLDLFTQGLYMVEYGNLRNTLVVNP